MVATAPAVKSVLLLLKAVKASCKSHNAIGLMVEP